MQTLARLGVSHLHGSLPSADAITPLEILGERVIPIAAKF